MAGHNRHIAGETNEILAPIRAQTVVESGDLIWIYDEGVGANGGMIVTRAPDYYAYPMSSMSTTCSGLRRTQFIKGENLFLGVAMDASDSGVTEDIAVATSGQFRYPLASISAAATTSNVTAGMKVSVTSRPLDQYVMQGSSSQGCSAYIGYCTKTESGASFVDFFLRTDKGPAAIIS